MKRLQFVLFFIVLITHFTYSKENVVLDENIELKINERVSIRNCVTLEITDVIFEEITPTPFSSDAYPAGTGVSVGLLIKNNGKSIELELTQLSAPYESKNTIDSNGFRFNLIEVKGYNDPLVTINIQTIK